MTFSGMTWHLLRKDVRHQMLSLGALWALAVLLPFSSLFELADSVLVVNYLYSYCFQILAVIIMVRCVILDPISKSITFIASRPIGWLPLISSKLLFATATIVLPNCLGTLLAVYLLGLHFSVEDTVICVFETSVRMSALLSFTVAFSMFFSSFTAVVLGLLAWGVALIVSVNLIVIILVNIPDISDFFTAFHTFKYDSPPSFGLSGAICTMILAPVIALIRYGRRTFRVPFGVFLGAICITYFVAQHIILEGVLADKDRDYSKEVDAIQVVLPEADINPVAKYDSRFNAVYVPIKFSGVKPPLAFSQRSVRYIVEFTFDNNLRFNENLVEEDPLNPQELQMLYSEPILRKLVGLKPDGFEEDQTDTARIFSCPILYKNHSLPLANKIYGEVYLPFGEIETAPESIPLKDGGTFVYKRFKFSVFPMESPREDQEQHRLYNRDFHFQLVQKSVPLALRGESLLENEFPGQGFLFRQDNQQDEGEVATYTNHFLNPFCLEGVGECSLIRPEKRYTKDEWAAWVSHASITFWDVSNFYWKKVPFVYTQVKIPQDPRRLK